MLRKSKILASSVVAASAMAIASPAAAGPEPYLGEIQAVGFNFCPNGWLEANGQLLPIAQNSALFSLLGVTYGGDGQTTFALPDLRGRVPVHAGQGPGLSLYTQGQMGGTESVTLTTTNMPAHNHNPRIQVSRIDATLRNPIDAYVARAAGDAYEKDTAPQGHQMAADAIVSQTVGGSQPFSTMQPYLVLRYCVAVQGVFPSRP